MTGVRVTQQYIEIAVERVTVLTGEATSVVWSSETGLGQARLNGYCWDLHGEASLSVYFEYGTDPDLDGCDTTTPQSVGIGSFYDDLTDIDLFGRCFFRACATDGVTTWKGPLILSLLFADFSYRDDTDDGTLSNVAVALEDDSIELLPQHILSRTALWLDASDASTVTVDGSNRVAEWADKSGNDRDAIQPTDINKPVLTASGLGGNSVIRFDGVDDRLNVLTGVDLVRHQAAFSMYVVLLVDGVPSSNTEILGFSVSTSRSVKLNLAVIATTGVARVAGRRVDSDSFLTQSGTSQVDTTNGNIIAGVVEYSKALAKVYLDGELEGTNDSFQVRGKSDDTDSQIVLIGCDLDTSVFLDADIAEIICFQEALSADLQQALEGYLAHKWGMEGCLSVDHPYKSNPPSFSSGYRITDEIDLSSLSGAEESKVTWVVNTPSNTTFTVDSRISEDDGANWSEWAEVTLNGAVPGLSEVSDFSNALLQFRQNLSSTDDTATPSLSYFEVFIAEEAWTSEGGAGPFIIFFS